MTQIRFTDGASLRDDIEEEWLLAVADGSIEHRPWIVPRFVCGSCGESKPVVELVVAMVREDRSQKGVCEACYCSFWPPSLTKGSFGQ